MPYTMLNLVLPIESQVLCPTATKGGRASSFATREHVPLEDMGSRISARERLSLCRGVRRREGISEQASPEPWKKLHEPANQNSRSRNLTISSRSGGTAYCTKCQLHPARNRRSSVSFRRVRETRTQDTMCTKTGAKLLAIRVRVAIL